MTRDIYVFHRSRVAAQLDIDAEEIILIHGLTTLNNEETLSAFGITEGKIYVP